ncbi:GNAT family N-acetyltransferase [Streptomyces sp. NPDC002187]|uniref:GNAT family N-acetyltransferase n=1 Tax=Streptomyces sp. NPDC002187 TaxID=3364637 RepID=UPI0036C7F029
MTSQLRAPATTLSPALLLRPWHERDLPALIAAYRDPDLRRFTRTPVDNQDDALRWLDIRHQGRLTGTYLAFAGFEELEDGTEGRLVANAVLKRPDPGAPGAEVGYWTVAGARGTGVAPRALDTLTAWAFESFADDGLRHLELLHQVDNTASCRVAQKCGFRYETTLPARPPFPCDGHLHIRRAQENSRSGPLSVVDGSMGT